MSAAWAKMCDWELESTVTRHVVRAKASSLGGLCSCICAFVTMRDGGGRDAGTLPRRFLGLRRNQLQSLGH